jgi:hypothetical protein
VHWITTNPRKKETTMPVTLGTTKEVVDYVRPAIGRAMCHAQNVANIVPLIRELVMQYALPGTIQGRGTGNTASGNMGWFVSKLTQQRYAVCYNHTNGMIEIRSRSQVGPALYLLNNQTPQVAIRNIFSTL